MALDWLNTPLDADIGELIARKRRSRAIEALREQLLGRVSPSANVRLQLADLLVQTGRGAEAIPVLLGLADEFGRDGFIAKAIAVLKRIEKIEPGRADVEERLAALVQRQTRATAPRPAVRRRRPEHPELGIELIEDVPAPEEAPTEEASTEEASTEEAPPEEAPTEEAVPVDAPAAEVPPAEPPLAAEPADVVEPAAPEAILPEPLSTEPATTEPSMTEPPTTEPSALPPAPDTQAIEPSATGRDPDPPAGVGRRLQRVFRRLLASFPGGGARPEESVTPEPEAEGEARVEPAAEAELEAVEGEAEPPAESPVEPEIEVEPETEPEPPMSDEQFQDELLGIAADVLRRPVPPPEARPDAAVRERSIDLAQRLLGSRLFRELDDAELLAVVAGLRLHTCEPGDIVVSEGEAGRGLFLVTSGSVKVLVTNPEGRNFEVGAIGEGDFFGEIASLSGRPRTATVVAAERSELLELDGATLDSLARTHPRVTALLDDAYLARASSPEAAAVRSVRLDDPEAAARAAEVLRTHFGATRWDRRMRLRLADVLLRADQAEEALPILIGLADDLARAGASARAVALIKKIEQVQRRDVEVVNLAPLLRDEEGPPPPADDEPPSAPPRRPRTDERFQGWLVDVMRDALRPAPSAIPGGPGLAAARGYGPGLLANPLFEDFSEGELLAVVERLRLLTLAPGDVIVTEGERGQGVFVLTSGRVKVFVRGPERRNVPVAVLTEGTFFGEMAALSGRPRSATVTAALPCDLLELDAPSLDAIASVHPRVRTVLEEFARARAADPEARRARGPEGPA